MIVNDRKELDDQLDFWQRAFEKAAGIPAPNQLGSISTLNGKGAMHTSLDPISNQWVKAAAETGGPVIDIGCAYGVASLEALKEGAVVFATDMHLAHLKLLRQLTPEHHLPQLRTRAAAFPYRLKVRPRSMKAVLCARLFHLFDGETIVDAVDAIWKMLEPGGMVYIISQSPYVSDSKPIASDYDTRLLGGFDWPGWSEEIHTLCPQILSRVFGARGFLLREARLINENKHGFFSEAAYVGQKPKLVTD